MAVRSKIVIVLLESPTENFRAVFAQRTKWTNKSRILKPSELVWIVVDITPHGNWHVGWIMNPLTCDLND